MYINQIWNKNSPSLSVAWHNGECLECTDLTQDGMTSVKLNISGQIITSIQHCIRTHKYKDVSLFLFSHCMMNNQCTLVLNHTIRFPNALQSYRQSWKHYLHRHVVLLPFLKDTRWIHFSDIEDEVNGHFQKLTQNVSSNCKWPI